MFKSKSFLISVWVAIFVSALAWWVYSIQKTTLPDIFQYVPTGIEQVMVNRAEKNMQNNANALIEVPQAVQQQFQQIRVMIIAQDQSFSGEKLLFLQTRTSFSPEDFLKTINPENETTSTYLRLDDWQYVFWPQPIIQSYIKPTIENSLFKQPELKKYLSIIKKSSLSVIANNNNLFNTESQYSSLLDSAKYLLMNIYSEPGWKFDFSAYVLFSQQQTWQKTLFKPQFTSLLKDSTIAYLELGKVLSNTDSLLQTMSWSIQDLLFKKLLTNNIAIVVSKWANMFNLGLTIIADNSSLYNDLEPLFPVLASFFESQPMFSDSQITSVQQPWKIGYDIMLQWIQKIGLYLEQKDNKTQISIWNPQIEWKKIKLKGYSKNALVVLYVDMNQILDIYKQFTNIWVNPSVLSASQEAVFTQMKDRTLKWEVVLEKDFLGVKWSIR